MAEAATPPAAGAQVAAGLLLGAAGACLAADWRIAALAAGAIATVALALWALARPLRWLALFAVLTLLTPPLPVELGSTGPHLTLLAAAFGAAGLLTQRPALRLPATPAGLALLAYLAVLVLSAGPALWISGATAAGSSLIRTALLGITLLAYLSLRSRTAPPEPRRWILGLLALGCVAALIGCLDFVLQLEPPAGFASQMVWLSGGTVRRAQGVFYDAAQFGNVCAFFLVGVAAAAMRRVGRPAHLATAATILAAALVFSFSRGAMLNVTAGLAVLALWERRSLLSDARLLVAAAAVAASAAALAAVAAPEFTSSYALRFAYTAWRSVADPAEALGVRLESWGALLAMLADHPSRLLLGAGYKTLATTNAAGAPLIVDNQWLAALGATGLLGVAALAILLAAILRSSWRAARSADATASLLGLWSFCFWAGQLVQMLFVDLMTYWRVLPLYLAVLALAEVQSAGRRA